MTRHYKTIAPTDFGYDPSETHMEVATEKLTPPLKWHGGKGAFHGKLAEWIISLMPPHTHYVEPYFGGGAVLLAKDPEGVSEVVNDINGPLTNFWHVLANPSCFLEFQRIVEAIPVSQVEWLAAGDTSNFRYRSIPVIDEAVKFFVRCRQSRAGQMRDFATLSRTRVRRGMNEQASAWLTAVEGLPAVHSRLKRVVILNDDALKVIRQQDGPETCFYLDPPYVHETRESPDVYQHEMSARDHERLLECLADVQGTFLLSGYYSELYDTHARRHGWTRHDFEIVNNASGKKAKDVKTECVWTNYTGVPHEQGRSR